MFKSSDGIILEDCLFSFILLSSFLLLMANYLTNVYQLKAEIANANETVISLKDCALYQCPKSVGNNTAENCREISINGRKQEVCIEI